MKRTPSSRRKFVVLTAAMLGVAPACTPQETVVLPNPGSQTSGGAVVVQQPQPTVVVQQPQPVYAQPTRMGGPVYAAPMRMGGGAVYAQPQPARMGYAPPPQGGMRMGGGYTPPPPLARMGGSRM